MLSEVVKEILKNNAILILNPKLFDTSPDEFLDLYGHLLDRIALVAKDRSGYTFYPSNSAPKDREHDIFFHSFCTIADNMGIKVDALMYVHGDTFLSQNADFKVITSEGHQVPLYACPSHEYLSQYTAAIASEIARYPIDSLILDDMMYPSKKTCLCDRCRRRFSSKVNIERDFSFKYLESQRIMVDWTDFRSNWINQTLREVTDHIKSQKNIDILFTVKTDKDTGFFKGAHENFGQSITELTRITNNVVVHLNPWNDLPSSTNDPEYNEILNSLELLQQYGDSGVNYSLLLWDVSTIDRLNIALKLRDDLKAEKIYLEPYKPEDFTKRRTLNLGF